MDIKEVVETYGIKNVRVFTKMPVCQSLHKFGFSIGIKDRKKMVMTECQIVESRYKVAEGYKLTLQPVNPGDGEPLYVGSEHYYQCDFNNIRRQNPDAFKIYILVDEDGQYERLREQIAA